MQRIGTLSKTSLAAIWLFYASSVIFPYAIPLATFATAVNLANIHWGFRYQMGQVFICALLLYVVLCFPQLLVLCVWHFSLKRYGYNAWLSTFDEDWAEKNRYSLWWKLTSLDSWMSKYLKPFF